MRPIVRIASQSPPVFLTVLLVLVVGIRPWSVHAETTLCTAITTAPTTISTPGIYCLTQDISTNLASGDAITIAANNVVLDLNGHRLGNLAAGTGTMARGIFANQRRNLNIKNGTVRGFVYGILLLDSAPYTASQGHVVEDIRADQNTFTGISVSGLGNIVRNNQVIATGGTTAFGANADVTGIWLIGSESRALNNDVVNTFATGTGHSFALEFLGGADHLAVHNRITQAEYGIFYASSTGKYRDNLTSGVTTPFAGGTDAGNNQ